MADTLIIAEKPSIAKDISQGLDDTFRKGENQLRGEKYVITWTVGHCLTLKDAHEYDPKFKSWTLEHLPIVPAFEYKVIKGKEPLIKTIKSLVHSDEIKTVVMATDAEREGQLIGQSVLDYVGNNKPVKRLWTSKTLSPRVVKEEFKALDNCEMYQGYFTAAEARQRADWIVGINATRAFSLLCGANGKPYSIGRVQTPTLAMIVNRQREIDSFDKRAYWTLTLKTSTTTGEMFACSWIGLDSDIEGLGQKQHEIGKLEKEVLAQQVVARLQQSPEGEVFLKINERKSTPPPLLFSITTLQQEANRIFGFTMDETLDIAQSLYEKHKATTYPRTESNHLEEEQVQTVPGVLESIKQMGIVDFDPAVCVVQESNKRVFDKTKLTDHFAIIPTGNMQNGMVKDKELQLYTLICQRFISAFLPSYQYDSSQILLKFDKDIYQATGITPVEQGWRSVYGSTCDADEGEKEDIVQLPDVEDGDLVFADEVDINKKFTKPPRPYTDRTLSKDMSNARKFVDDPDMAAILKETAGLGQPATRAEIIKTLEKRRYITRKGRSILPTEKAFTLIDATRDEQVSKPALSALWEQQMAEMVKGRSSDNSEFLEGVGEYISELVKKIAQMKIDLPETQDSQNQVIARCPECGKDVVEREKSFSCTGYPQCKFAMWKDCMKFAGKPSITTGQAQKLLAGKIVHFKGLVSKKTQKKYEADVVFKKSEKYGWRPSLIFGEKT